MNVFYHTGDFGDALASLPVVRHLGGGEFYLGPHAGAGWPREPMTELRARFLLPLLSAQPYITKAAFGRPTHISHDFSHFRLTHKALAFESLVDWQARHFRINPRTVDLSPWLRVTPAPDAAGAVVVSRSLRYHNPLFPWKKFLYQCAGKTRFIGLESEHAEFSRLYGKVPHYPVVDALHMAQFIAGSTMFIGNQSFPCWVAMALGTRLVQETWRHCPNSVIKRPNAIFCDRG